MPAKPVPKPPSVLAQVITRIKKAMAAIDDLQANAAAIVSDGNALIQDAVTASAAMQAALTLIQGLQAGTVNVDDPQVEAVALELKAADANIQTSGNSLAASAQALNAALNPPATGTVASAAVKS